MGRTCMVGTCKREYYPDCAISFHRCLNNAVQGWTKVHTMRGHNVTTLAFLYQCESFLLQTWKLKETAANKTWAPVGNNISVDYTIPVLKEITTRLPTSEFVDASTWSLFDAIAREPFNSTTLPIDNRTWGPVASSTYISEPNTTWDSAVISTCYPPVDDISRSWCLDNVSTWEPIDISVGYIRVDTKSWGPGDKIISRSDNRNLEPTSRTTSYPQTDTSTWGSVDSRTGTSVDNSTWGLGENSTQIPEGNNTGGQVVRSTSSYLTIVKRTLGPADNWGWRSVDKGLNPSVNSKWDPGVIITFGPIGSIICHPPIDNSMWDSSDKNTLAPVSSSSLVSVHNSMRYPVHNSQELSINRTSTSTNNSELAVRDKIQNINKRPIIGVLTQEQSSHLNSKYPTEKFTSYVASSYVKLVESSGARVVPILIGKNRKYYEDLMAKINGVLFPGGATYFNQSDGFADAGQHIYEIAQEYNDAGDYFPIFGICLGFELLIILASGRGEEENRVTCFSYCNRPLNFTPDSRTSKMFRPASEEVISILANEDVTVNAHQFCIIDENFELYNLHEDWRVTSHSEDDNGKEFIASVEHKRYPFYGVQFHPEKSSFEWKSSKNYPHTANAIKANRYFLDFFVAETRKNFHSFGNVSEENEFLIYNYEPYFTGALGSVYLQCYFFDPRIIIASDGTFTDDEVT